MFRHPDVAHGGIGAQTLAGRSGAAPHGRGRHRSRSGCRDGTAKSRRARRPRWGPLGEDHAARPGIVRLEPVRGEEPVQAFQRIRALHHQPEDQRQIPPNTHIHGTAFANLFCGEPFWAPGQCKKSTAAIGADIYKSQLPSLDQNCHQR